MEIALRIMMLTLDTALMASPADKPRNHLREVVRGDARSLYTRSRKWLTLHAEYAFRDAHPDFLNEKPNPKPVYSIFRDAYKGFKKPRPFESGANVLPGLEAWCLRWGFGTR